MKTCIALLRGINVSGKNLIKMAELRNTLVETGLQNIRTYIQSGNIVFESDEAGYRLADLIAAQIHTRFGFNIPVIVLLQDELRLIRDNNPFIGTDGIIEKQLYVTLLSSVPEQAVVDHIRSLDFSPDQLIFAGRAIYLNLVTGAANTKITNALLEKKLKVNATARNWNTVMKLCEM